MKLVDIFIALQSGIVYGQVDVDTQIYAGAADAVNTLMTFYNENGLFDTTGWWNSANCLTALTDYMLLTGDHSHMATVDNTIHLMSYEKNRFFRNEYYDDTLWWGLMFLKAYDITGDRYYLDLAIGSAEWVNDVWDEKCGGGVYWARPYRGKNAIANGLFLKLTASLARRLPESEEKFRWTRRAVRGWDWFRHAGYFYDNYTIMDGLNIDVDPCVGDDKVGWTYNQGVIIGALTELAKIFPSNDTYLKEADAIHNATLHHKLYNNVTQEHPQGVLMDFLCTYGWNPAADPQGCGNDLPTFKGVYMRNIAELNRHLPDRPYTEWIQAQALVNLNKNKNADGVFSLDYQGLNAFNESASVFTAATHCAGLEAVVAGLNADYKASNSAVNNVALFSISFMVLAALLV